MVSSLGELSYRRRVYRCSRCGAEHAPLDGALGLAGQLTGGAAEAGALLLAEMPAASAARTLRQLTGVRISRATLDRLKGRLGPRARAALEAEQDRWLEPVGPERPAPATPDAPPALVVRQADGVMVRYRDGWHEVKVGVSYGLGEPKDKGGRIRVAEPKYCALRGRAETLGGQIQALSLSQGLRQAAASQFISDGGNWMRGLAEGVLGWSSWTVDYYHASAQVASALEALHGPGAKPMQRAHRRLRRKLLKASGNAAVRRSLRAQSRRRRLTPDNERTVAHVVSYLERHEAQTRYDQLKRWQWPIGSGMIEGGGCKLYIQQRFKRPGARWSEKGFDNLEAIRRFLYNDQWDRFRSLLYSQN